MPLTFQQFLEANDAENSGAPQPFTRQQRAGNVTAANEFQTFDDLGLIDFGDSSGSDNSVSNARANRSAALKQLTIQRKKLEFQKKTGLRDIGQARTTGLRGAVNDALQRGIFRSGIRIENTTEVNREADEATSDLTTNIQFALDDLAARREGISAQKFGGGGGGTTPPLTIEQAKLFSQQNAINKRANILDPASPEGLAPGPPPPVQTGVTPIVQPGGPQ